MPDKPPYTAHVGNLSYDATTESVTDFFSGCNVANVRIIEDRENQRPKGFGYVEFGDVDGLKKALTLDGESFEGRMMKIKIADPRKQHSSEAHDVQANIRQLAAVIAAEVTSFATWVTGPERDPSSPSLSVAAVAVLTTLSAVLPVTLLSKARLLAI